MRAKFLLVCLMTTAALATEKPADFTYGIAIQADGKDALYQLGLPASVYRGIASRDLADVRVFNAAGEVVPYAFRVRAATDVKKSAPISLKIFPIHGDESKGLSGLSLNVQRTTAGTVIKLDEGGEERSQKLLGYLADASMLGQALHSIELDVKADADYAAKVTIEASDDLAAWTTLVAGAPLVSLAHGGERLLQRRIEFPARKAKYFRISWTGLPQGAQLAGAVAEYGDTRIDTARQWEMVAGHSVADKAGEYSFDTQGHFPTDRLHLDLPEANTVVQFQLFTRNRVQDPWRAVTRGLAYRLRRDGAEIVSPSLAIGADTARYWLLRVDQRGGGLGAGEPRLSLGWLPHDLVFAARGEGPFTLAFGNRDAKTSAYAIESLVPGYHSDADIDASVATIQVAPKAVNAIQPDKPTLLGGESVLDERIDPKKWILWGCLAAGVLFLGWMAWRLLKQMDAPSDSA